MHSTFACPRRFQRHRRRRDARNLPKRGRGAHAERAAPLRRRLRRQCPRPRRRRPPRRRGCPLRRGRPALARKPRVYYTYADAGLARLASSSISPDGNSTELRFVSTIGAAVTKDYRAMLADMRAALQDALDVAPGALQGGITGALVINADSAEAVARDIGSSDGVTVAISFLLLAAALRSVRLVALTAAALAAAFGAAFLLTWPLSASLSTPNFTTSLLISTLVSLSLDYSLFLLTHYKRSMTAGVPPRAAVEAMLRSGGHTVLVSGATLAACFLVLAILPVSIVRAPGIAATFAVV